MRTRNLFLIILTTALLIGGCTAAPRTPDAAVPVAQSFMEARAAGDAGALYALLTEAAQQAISRADLASYLKRERVTYERLGDPVEREDGWVQITVVNLAIASADTEILWPEVLLTLRHDGSRWRVSWADPLTARALRAYDRGEHGEQLTLGRTIADIDPFHYRGYLEMHFAYRGLNRLREAEHWLNTARAKATPVQIPSVEDATARFKLSLGDAKLAAVHARLALDMAQPYVPGTYSPRWQVDTMVVLGRALLTQGDRPGAQEIANRALEIDPQNGTLAIFRYQLNNAPPKQ